jgi:hypothetical protein
MQGNPLNIKTVWLSSESENAKYWNEDHEIKPEMQSIR